jgi:hypothetical protein
MGKESSKNPTFVTAATGLAPNQQIQSEKKAASQEAAFLFSIERDKRFVLRKQVEAYKHLK